MPLRRNRIDIDIDDGVRTSLSSKGDGVKSLVTIAMLSQLSTQGQRLIIIDEPENHLHPEAIHYIDNVLRSLAKKYQVIISTHNPLFINRNNISSNLIVDSGTVNKAKHIKDIRKTLGVICSDNLIGADYMILVEGPSDEEIIKKCIEEDVDLNQYLKSKLLVVKNMGGIDNLKIETSLVQQQCYNYMIIIDYDSEGKNGASLLKSSLSIPDNRIRFFMKASKKETELEDYINPEIYQDYLNSKGINISNSIFKDQSLKWSKKIEKLCANVGIDFTKEMEFEMKKYISHNLVLSPIKSSFTEDGYRSICAILELKQMENNE